MKTFVCLGFNVDKERGYVTGLAMMHDLFVNIVREHGYNVISISLNSRTDHSNGRVGEAGFRRYFEYVTIIWEVMKAFITNKNVSFYFNPSTAKVGFYRDVLLVALAKLFGHKVLMQQFGNHFESFKNSLGRFGQRMLVETYNRVDLLIVEGEHAKKQYSFIKNPEKIKVIPNGLPELNKGIVKSPKHYKEGERFNLFFMNNMIVSKGYVDVLLAVDTLINELHRNVTCVFAGKFMLLKDDNTFKTAEDAKIWFDTFVEKKHLNDRVMYLPSVFDEKKVEEFRKAHVFMLPSYYEFEGQPTAILEALSYGCVPVVTPFSLIPDMVDDSCGRFVEARTPTSIVNAIVNLMDNSSVYQLLSKNAYDRFNKDFTQEAYAQRILSVVETI